jgi:hypothetical protein
MSMPIASMSALVIAGDAGANVGFLLLTQCHGRGIGKMGECNDYGIEMPFYAGGGRRDGNMRMSVNGGARRPSFPPGLAVPARRRRRVFVPLLGHALFPFPRRSCRLVEPLRDPTRRRHGVAMLGLVSTRPNLQTHAATLRTLQDAARPAHRPASPDAPRRGRRLSPY